ncbi:MAG: hypothetical protein NUW37_05125 [Planctomycetes bacterium]|nr:hypothetical protein [Planctomycetota bacterium]
MTNFDPEKQCAFLCRARCCRYITTRIVAPRKHADFDEIRWFLAHRGVKIFISQRKWYLQVQTPCEHLNENNYCNIWPNHFDVCKDYDPKDCEFTGNGDWDIEAEWTSTAEFDAWREAKRNKPKTPRKKQANNRDG